MRDPACKRGPASIGTSESDPRPVCGCMRGPASTQGPAFNRSFTVYRICIWNEYKTKDKRRHLYQHYSTTSAISVLLRCNSDVSFPILGYLNRAKNSWAMGDWGGRPPRPPLNTPLLNCAYRNFGICWLIFKKLSPSDSAVIVYWIGHSHHTLNASIHYLVKVQCSKIDLISTLMNTS